MVRCPHCGLYHTAATEYCPEKGLPIYAPQRVETHSKRNLLWVVIVLAIVALTACVLAAINLIPRFIKPGNGNANQVPIIVPTLTLAPLSTRLPLLETAITEITEVPTVTETLAPSPTIQPWQACPDSPYLSQLQPGMNAKIALDPPLPNRVRDKPSIDSNIIGYIDPGGEVEILEGPSCAQGWTWWKVKSVNSSLTGWTAEGDKDGYWLIPIE